MIAKLTTCLAAAFLAVLAATVPARAEVNVQAVTSPGGLTAWLVEERTIPFVALEIRFKGGASLDAPGKRGAINLMTGLIEEGAGDLDAQGFAQAVESLATSFEFSVYDDALSISAKMLSENRDAAVDLLRAALIEPRFDEDAIERVRGQVASIIRSDATDQGRIANARFDAAAFGDHPYGVSHKGTLESVAALTRDDILAAHRAVLNRERVYISAVGDISAKDLGKLIDRLLGDLPASGAPLPPRVDAVLDPGTTVVDYDSPQSTVVFGHAGLARLDPDFVAAYVVNEVMGSGGESRLMQEVREKRGLTYGVGSYLVPMQSAEMILGQVSSANDKVGQAIDVIREQWALMAEKGITAEELADIKLFLTGGYALRFDGNAPIARILVGMQMEGLPIDYISTRNADIEALTLDEVNRVAARLYQPDRLHFVVVGQPEMGQ